MTRTNELLLVALPLALTGCSDVPVSAADVISLSVCSPADDGCRPVADGRSLVTVTACAPGGNRVSPLTVTLHLSSSSWLRPNDPTDKKTFTASLDMDRCVSPAFVTDTQPGPVRIDADLMGFRATRFVQLAPAPLQSLTVVPNPATLTAAQANIVTLTPSATATNGGSASDGTRVSWRVTEVVPSNGIAFVLPAETALDATSTAQLHTDSTVTRAAVKAIAILPQIAGADPASAASTTVVISVVP